MENILNEIRAEREKQEVKWGEQNHPILNPRLIDQGGYRMCKYYRIPDENEAKDRVEYFANYTDRLTYMDILIEEISESVSCGPNTVELRKELIQSAAVIVAMIESLERNGR